MSEKPERPQCDTGEGVSASTATGSRQKKKSLPPPKYNPNTPNDWWPFDRVDGRILVRAHRNSIQDLEEAPI
jgi:hypothetical protein